MKWLGWNYIYNQWFLKEELKHVQKLKQQFDKQMILYKRSPKDRRV